MTPRPTVTDRAAGGITVRRMEPPDASGVLAVYAEGIATGDATFETTTPTWDEWDRSRLPDHRFVAVPHGLRVDPQIGLPALPAVEAEPAPAVLGSAEAEPVPALLGWVAVSRVSPRTAYAGVVEHSIYVADAARGRGVGGALLGRLVESCDAGGIWTIQSGVFPENAASLALHERFGFRRVGVRERIGRRDGRWRDVVLLERRSSVVGVDP